LTRLAEELLSESLAAFGDWRGIVENRPLGLEKGREVDEEERGWMGE